MLLFEWDPNKAASNLNKHGVTFDEATTVFQDTLSLTIDDPLHSADEERLIIIWISHKNRILVVVHTEREDKVRMISVRNVTNHERRYYESNV